MEEHIFTPTTDITVNVDQCALLALALQKLKDEAVISEQNLREFLANPQNKPDDLPYEDIPEQIQIAEHIQKHTIEMLAEVREALIHFDMQEEQIIKPPKEAFGNG